MKNFLWLILCLSSLSIQAKEWTEITSKPIMDISSMAFLDDELIGIVNRTSIVKIDYDKGTTIPFIPTGSFSKDPILTDVYVAKDHTIYCVDQNNKEIVIFEQDGAKRATTPIAINKPICCYFSSKNKLWIGGEGIACYENGVLQSSSTQLMGKTNDLPTVKDFQEIEGNLFFVDRRRGVFQLDKIENGEVYYTKAFLNDGTYSKSNQCAVMGSQLLVVSQNSKTSTPGLYCFPYMLTKPSLVAKMGVTGKDALGVATKDEFAWVSTTNSIQKLEYQDETAPVIVLDGFEITGTTSAKIKYHCNENVSITLEFLQDGTEIEKKVVDYKVSEGIKEVIFDRFVPQQMSSVTLTAVDKEGNTSSKVTSTTIKQEIKLSLNVLSRIEKDFIPFVLKTDMGGSFYYVISDDHNVSNTYTTADQILNDPSTTQIKSITPGDNTLRLHIPSSTPKRLYYIVTNGLGDQVMGDSKIIMPYQEMDKIQQRVLYSLTGHGSDLSEKWLQKHIGYLVDRADKASVDAKNYVISSANTALYLKLDKTTQKDDTDREHLRTLLTKVLFPLSMVYQIESPNNPYYHKPETKEQIVHLFDYIYSRGFNNTCYKEFQGGGIYLTLSSYFYSAFLMRDDLIIAGSWPNVLKTCRWWTEWSLMDNFDVERWNKEDKNRTRNSDYTRTFYRNKMLTLLMSGAHKSYRNEEMIKLSRVINEACQFSPGWGGMIKRDYTGFHHHGFWGNAYNAGGVMMASDMAFFLSGTPYALKSSALENLGNYWLAQIFYSNRYDIPYGVAGRFPNNRSTLMTNELSILSLCKALPNGKMKQQLEGHFMTLWNSTDAVKDQKARDVQCSINFTGSYGHWADANTFVNSNTVSPITYTEGNRTFPYAAFQVHRFKDKMISVKGFNKYVWDFENNGEQNFFGYNQSNGALEIIGTQDIEIGAPSAKASGWSIDGYDWAHIPGVTAYNIPIPDLKYKRSYDQYAKFCFDYFAGGVSLMNQYGMYGYRFKDLRTLKSGKISLRAMKSYTFFGNYVVCLGSNIQSTLDTYPVHTTIFQNHINIATDKTIFNGVAQTGILNSFKGTNSATTITDSKGISYYFPSGSALELSREEQTSRDDRDRKDTKGTFEKLIWDHGQSPKSNQYSYIISLDGEKLIQDIATAPNDYVKVIQQNGSAHILYSKQMNLYGYSFFEATNVASPEGVIESIDSDAMVMVHQKNNQINLSLSHLDLGLLPKDKHYNMVWDVDDNNRWNESEEQQVSLVLRGEWDIKQNSHERAVVSIFDPVTKTTTLLFKTIYGASKEISLEQKVSTLSSLDLQAKDIQVYPNPFKNLIKVSLGNNKAVMNLNIRDIRGNIILSRKNCKQQEDIILDSFPNGIYFLEISDIYSNRQYATKLIKQ
ncbi:T9SS type A sorting domain-containing protein [Halosquirtibacter laminarini]|uniref:T9SS type A sorting domain-containing protein n=1 Tax=Halosquirtibacter laminarini TaxID=3374600 RepID=A0AC61NPR1_9BACT|nr:T9SS type A sorting domain-containing protein [Prolixibacteraceae bacterium]